MAADQTTVPVGERALLARINRLLQKEGQVLRRCRSDSKWYGDLGDYYAIDLNRNSIEAQHVDLEKWGREMGVLREYEKLADE